MSPSAKARYQKKERKKKVKSVWYRPIALLSKGIMTYLLPSFALGFHHDKTAPLSDSSDPLELPGPGPHADLCPHAPAGPTTPFSSRRGLHRPSKRGEGRGATTRPGGTRLTVVEEVSKATRGELEGQWFES
ncbi:hypothetical protein LZ32DRAFT_366764 [Colletotrichum eremochloae]|nr:hypothetical protein LZ32DRAFT_366764 [Colletotrichum eremochloae]